MRVLLSAQPRCACHALDDLHSARPSMRRELIQVSLPSTSPAASTKACFADLESGTVGDLVKTLLVEDGPDIAQELGCEVDGDSDNKLDSRKWGLQRVTLSEPNRRWSDEELLALDQVTG